MELDPDIREYYEKGEEAARLGGGFPSGPLERARTEEIVERYLPAGPLNILDVGGGPGVYAAWLADKGHKVHLVDPVELHVEQARAAHGAVTAEVGDARQLTQADSSVDVVLLLGPLYHLIARDDRVAAVREARRVLKPDGLVFATGISRFAALLDLLIRMPMLHAPEVFEVIEGSVLNGIFRGADAGFFTTAYCHLPHELGQELGDVGFDRVVVLPVEGPGAFVTDFEERWADPDKREVLIEIARMAESQPHLLATTGHLLAVGRALP